MDEYLKLLLEQIRCTKARPYIKQELQDHMEDQIAENMKAGMDHEQAEKEAVRDMGDPVETGISLDSIHRPQAAWKLLGMIIFISIAGVLIHAGISGKASENAAAGSDRYVFHVMIGLAVMMILYLLDYTVLAKFSKIIAAILLCCVLAVLIFAVFNTALRQKNQLGMMMGCGCGIVFLISFLINVLENLGVFPQSITFLPFFSAGGSCIIVSYGLMGIVLSTYRYKNIYPRHPETGFMSINSKVKKVS